MWLYIVFGIIVLFGFMAFTGAPYVPSKRRDLERAFTELYALKATDHLVDIGSGDGIVLRVASRAGAKATGLEINPVLCLIARWFSRGDENVSVRIANLWTYDFPDDSTVVYTFGDARDIPKMAVKVEEQATRLKRPLSFISYAFEIPGHEKVRTVGAHHLYMIQPLRKAKP